MEIKDKNYINEIKNGMYQVKYIFMFKILPERLIKIFNSDELELFINGTPFIDLEDWRTNTIYKGYNQNDEVILFNIVDYYWFLGNNV